MTEKDKALAGLEFVRGDYDLKKARDRAEQLCFELNQTPPTQSEKRKQILSELLPHAQEGFFIKPPFSYRFFVVFSQTSHILPL